MRRNDLNESLNYFGEMIEPVTSQVWIPLCFLVFILISFKALKNAMLPPYSTSLISGSAELDFFDDY
jgi:hypothetical protein